MNPSALFNRVRRLSTQAIIIVLSVLMVGGCSTYIYLPGPIGEPVPAQELNEKVAGTWNRADRPGKPFKNAKPGHARVIRDGLIELDLTDASGMQGTVQIKIYSIGDQWVLNIIPGEETFPPGEKPLPPEERNVLWAFAEFKDDQLWIGVPNADVFSDAIDKGQLKGKVERTPVDTDEELARVWIQSPPAEIEAFIKTHGWRKLSILMLDDRSPFPLRKVIEKH